MVNKMADLFFDYARCADFADDCPDSCFRAKITRNVDEMPEYVPLSWVHFEGTDGCPIKERVAK